VAELTRMRLNSSMDAAVATLNGARGHTRDILGLNPIAGTSPATLGLNVVKSGRSTGVTEGVVDGVSMSVSINYGDPGVVSFTNQIRIVPRPPWPGVDYEVSIGGDSGSVWMTESGNRAIGLHFAGETNPMPTSENAICSPIDPIAAELNFSFLPVFCPTFPKPPVFDLCRRYPWICRGLLRWPRLPFPDPGPVLDPGDRFRRFGGGGSFRQMGQRSGCNCNCSGRDDFDDEDLEMIMAMIAEYMDRRR
jgi:endonuclease G